MPDEFDFKNYSFEDFSKSVEGTRYLHDLYLRAVNHPIRRKILECVNMVKRISKKELFNQLNKNGVLSDENIFNYNMDFLIKSFCIKSVKDEAEQEIYFEITQSGKVVDYLE